MKNSTFFAISSLALSSLVSAAPLRKRDVVTELAVVTVMTTTTLWVDPTDAPAPATSAAQFYPESSVASPTPSSIDAVPTSATTQAAPVVSSDPVDIPIPSATSSIDEAPAVSAPVYTPPASTPSPVATEAPATTEAPTSVYTPPASTSQEAPAETSSSSSGGESGQYSGDITYYNPAGGYGSCGSLLSDTDDIVAIASPMMSSASTGNSNSNPWCGTKIRIHYGGNSYDAKVADTCPGCKSGDLDLSQGLFDKLTPSCDGRCHDVSWEVVN